MNLFFQPEIPAGKLWLSPDESKHAVRVLRMSAGEQLHLTDGKGKLYEARITNADSRKCEFEIISTHQQPKKPFYLHVAIAPTKNTDRIEWFVEKAVEIGIDRISFIVCDNSERRIMKLDRLEKLAISAMKQSGQSHLPELFPIVPFDQILVTSLPQKFIAFVGTEPAQHLKEMAMAEKDTLILIGPEGDFSQAEMEMAVGKGFRLVSLGQHRLRTETAGLAACHILNLINNS